MTAMEISVLVPSFKRPEVLARTLEHLVGQEPCPRFEVIVSIDGDHDHAPARLDEFRDRAPYELVVLKQSHQGQGVALNRALEKARAPYTLVIGDDIFAAKNFVAAHLERLTQLDDPPTAVQGITHWHPELFPDPFLEWESGNGAIFAFPVMTPYSYVSPEFLFTSNVSFTTEWLRSTDGFPVDVAWDLDTVFAFRSRKQGIRLFYDPGAVAWHYHTWSVDTEATRRYIHGHIAARLAQDDPEFADFVTHPKMNAWRKVRYAASKLIRPAAERLGPQGLRGWCWIHELNYQFAQGYVDQQAGIEVHPYQRPNY